ncbi:MAG TPA: YbaB/EbfC family nucleoid-associated protein [Sphingobacterium sp.]|nr:YbaB/EbfC family nucleoid-associated protein [Sphingobacterium sp.]
MFNKLFEAQKKAEEIKSRLDTISVNGEVEGGKVKVSATANKEIKDVSIEEGFYNEVEREELEELLVVAINKALSQAENISQAEMKAATQNMLGGAGGLGDLFK